MTNLKPCPCGKTPTHVIEHQDGVYGDCCYEWTAAVIGYGNKEEHWNSVPRAVPAVCPQCYGESVITDMDELRAGKRNPTKPCPTCAPFGGRGAIMVEAGEQQPEGEG